MLPTAAKYGGGGMTEGRDGIYIAWEIFSDYGTNGSLSNKQMVMFALDRLLGDNKSIVTNLPSQGLLHLHAKRTGMCAMFFCKSRKTRKRH